MTDPLPDPTDALDAATATTGDRVLSGTLWNLVTNVLPPLYAFVQSIVAARFLGPDGMGRQSYIAWATLSLATLFTGGLPRALVRFVGRTMGEGRPGAVRDLLAWAWRLETLGAVLAGSLLGAIGVTRSTLQAAWLFAALACALAVMQAVPSAVLGGLQRWREASIIGIVTGALGTVAIIVVLAAGGGIAGMFAVEAAVAAVNLSWAAAVARRVVPSADDTGEDEDTAPLRREVLGYAAVSSLQIVFQLVVWRRSELFFMNRYSTPEQMAIYAIPAAFVWAMQRLPAGFGTVLTPAVATLIGAGRHDRIHSGVSRAMRLSVLLSFPLTAVAIALGPAALTLAYGDDYRGLGRVLVVLLAAFPVVMAAKVAGSVLQGYGRLRWMIVSIATATAVDVVASVALIPDNGAFGAAIANTAAQLTSAGLNVAFVLRLTPVRWEVGALARAAVVSAIAGAAAAVFVALLPDALGVVAGAAIAAAVLLAGYLVAKPVPPADREWVDARLTRAASRLRRS